MISIIHPSRGRPEKSYATIKNWKSRSSGKNNIEWIIVLDDDDPELPQYDLLYKQIRNRDVYVHGTNKSAIDAINFGATQALGDIFVVVSDDTLCPMFWDSIILEDTKGKTDFVVKYPDGIQPEIVTMPVMDRTFYNRFGYIYNPVYRHAYCDTELTEVAKRLGRLIKRNTLFKHDHYSVNGNARDAIYERSDAHHDYGKKVFYERLKRNFDL